MFDYSTLELYRGLTEDEISDKMRERIRKYSPDAYRKALHGEKTRCIICNTGYYDVNGLSLTCDYCGHSVLFN